MNELTLHTMALRLERVERQLRRWRVLGTLSISAFGLGVLLGVASPQVAEEVRAKRFVLVDMENEERAWLAVSKDPKNSELVVKGKDGSTALLSVGGGGSVLRLQDKNEQLYAGLIAMKDFGSLTFYDKAEKSRATLLATRNLSSLSLSDNEGKDRASLDVGSDGEPSLSLQNKEAGHGALFVTPVSLRFYSGPEITEPDAMLRGSGLNLLDANHKLRASLGLGGFGWPSLTFRDNNERVRADLSVYPIGPAGSGPTAPVSSSLTLSDENEEPRAVLGHSKLKEKRTEVVHERPPSSLVLFDKGGTVIWEAP